MFISPGNPFPIAEDALGVGEAPDMLLLMGSRAEAACGESQVLCSVDAPVGPGVLLAKLLLSDRKPYTVRLASNADHGSIMATYIFSGEFAVIWRRENVGNIPGLRRLRSGGRMLFRGGCTVRC